MYTLPYLYVKTQSMMYTLPYLYVKTQSMMYTLSYLYVKHRVWCTHYPISMLNTEYDVHTTQSLC